MGKRILGIIVLIGIVGGAVAGSKKTDPDILASVGAVVGKRVKTSLPDRSKLAGPLTAFKLGDRFPIEEQVRVRIHSDKSMNGESVDVSSGSASGEVRLRGIVSTAALQRRAVEIAEATVGVEKVINEIAVPENGTTTPTP